MKANNNREHRQRANRLVIKRRAVSFHDLRAMAKITESDLDVNVDVEYAKLSKGE